MNSLIQKIEEAVSFLRNRIGKMNIRTGLVLGSGLGGLVQALEERMVFETSEIPHWPVSTVEGHRGCVVLGTLQKIPLLILQGRVHYYEGYSIQEVVFPIQVMAKLDIQNLILTNAAGSIREEFQPGDLMLIKDHINLMGVNPLIGLNEPSMGPRFPDMSSPYDLKFIEIIEQAAQENHLKVHQGVLAATMGPSYETRAEIQMIGKMGADAVCMSTVPEVIAGVQAGLRILGISCITNKATGLTNQRLTHREVKETAKTMEHKFIKLLKHAIVKIS